MISWDSRACLVTSSALMLIYLLYSYFKQKEVQLHFSKTHKNLTIIKSLMEVLRSYRPAVIIPTLIKLAISARKVKCLAHFDRMMVELPDGEEISLDWYPKNARKMDARSPVIILMPGIASDSRAIYANIFAKYAYRDYDFRVAIVNRRGYCGMPYRREDPDPITWNKFEDFDQVISVVKEQAPGANVYLAGLSMGGNFIKKFAGIKGLRGEELPVKAIGCVSSPYCLKVTTGTINSGIFFKRVMAKTLKETFENHLHDEKFLDALERRGINPERVMAANCTDEFNRLFSIQFTPYKDLDSYKEAVSSVGVVQHIQVPTLAVNVKTDPISPYSAIPFDEIEKNPNVIQVVVNGGGHLEYFSGLTLRRWSFDLVLSYFRNFELNPGFPGQAIL